MGFGITETTTSQKSAGIYLSNTIKRYLESPGTYDGLDMGRQGYKGTKNGF